MVADASISWPPDRRSKLPSSAGRPVQRISLPAHASGGRNIAGLNCLHQPAAPSSASACRRIYQMAALSNSYSSSKLPSSGRRRIAGLNCLHRTATLSNASACRRIYQVATLSNAADCRRIYQVGALLNLFAGFELPSSGGRPIAGLDGLHQLATLSNASACRRIYQVASLIELVSEL